MAEFYLLTSVIKRMETFNTQHKGRLQALSHPIFYYRKGSGYLSFYSSWRSEILATVSPFGPDRNGMDADPDIRIRIFRIFFSLLWTSWDLRVTPRMVRNHLIRIRTGKSGFSKIQIFHFFRLFKLKDATTWVSIDSPSPIWASIYT